MGFNDSNDQKQSIARVGFNGRKMEKYLGIAKILKLFEFYVFDVYISIELCQYSLCKRV